jgi:hypothetical protein
VSLVRFKTGLEEKAVVESMTVFNPQEVDTATIGLFLETRRGFSSKRP